ncbi:ExeM/NucH family extracellular endonuclease [Knoellia sp. CPCC 206391]
MTAANAVSPDIVISEVYGAGGNGTNPTYSNDFIELYNPTDSTVSVAGWSVQYRSATGSSVSGITPLTGSIPPKSHYLVIEAAGANAGTATMPAGDATGTISMAGGAGQVLLVSSTTASTVSTGNLAGNPALVDMVGYGAAGSYETVATTTGLTNITSAQRSAPFADTDHNNNDFSEAVPTPTKATSVATPLEATAPGDKSGQVGSPISGFTLAATGGTSPYSWSATGLPSGVTVAANGAVSGTPTTAGTYNVTATVTDSAAPTPATDDVTFTFTIVDAAAFRPIAEIQGTGSASPFDGQNLVTSGVVTASYPTGGLNGFYIQTAGADTPNASDGIFVYGGTSGFATYPAVGDSVEVAGEVDEFFTTTQLIASSVKPVASLGAAIPKTVVPGTDCALPGTDCLTGAALDTAREVVEGELFQPTAPWTLTDVYDGGPYYSNGTNSSANRGEMGVAANSAVPLVSPTEVIDAQATAEVTARKNYNDAHRIILDDAASLTYSTTQNDEQPFPWLTPTHSMRVGAGITFTKPVVFTYGFNAWRIQPQAQVVGAPTGALEIEQTRPAAPENVGGDLKLATFNVLNFFPTTGEEFVSSGLGTCSFFTDRDSGRTTVNSCNPNGPRGAANEANLARQRAKIVAAINTVGADIVSLEELENSVQFGKNRDFAIGELVNALNADAGAGTWAFVPSASVLPPLSEQDVIRNGFIYKPANAALVSESVVLADQSSGTEAFADAREPVAQAFKKVGSPDASAFGVIVNHFKSKGSGTPDPNGQGNANDRRILQANALVNFANDFQTQRGISRMFLAGDFNAYTEEDPIQVLKAAGYDHLESTSNPAEESYNFDGQIGSLDHVLVNEAAAADVNAVDIWDINSYESVYYEYSRFNTNVTDLYAPNPYRSSDHNPEVIGINVGPAASSVSATADQITYGAAGSVVATVTPSDATGTVTVSSGATQLGSAALSSGTATVPLAAKSLEPGTHVLTVTYSGDGSYLPSSTTVSVTVVKAVSTLTATASRTTLQKNKDTTTLTITAAASNVTPTGTVTVLVDGVTRTVTLNANGTATIVLGPFVSSGTKSIQLTYSGDARVASDTFTTSVTVVNGKPK